MLCWLHIVRQPFVGEQSVGYSADVDAFARVAVFGRWSPVFDGFEVPCFFFAWLRVAALLGLVGVVCDAGFCAGGQVEEGPALDGEAG